LLGRINSNVAEIPSINAVHPVTQAITGKYKYVEIAAKARIMLTINCMKGSRRATNLVERLDRELGTRLNTIADIEEPDSRKMSLPVMDTVSTV